MSGARWPNHEEKIAYEALGKNMSTLPRVMPGGDRSLNVVADAFDGVPGRVVEATRAANDEALRHHPGQGEWSAIEVIGHLVDKLGIWHCRMERIASQDHPTLELYDQDRLVRLRGYRTARLDSLIEALGEHSRTLADVLRKLPPEAAKRKGIHPEYGEITLLRCAEIPLESIDGHLEQVRAALATI